MSLYSPKKRQDFKTDRSGQIYDNDYYRPSLYAQRINQFENKVYSKFAHGLSKVGTNVKRVTGRVRHSMRRAGHRSLGALKGGADTVARMASVTDRRMRGIAKTATRGLRRMGMGVGRAGSGSIERMATGSTSFAGAAVRGLYKVSRAYAKGLGRARDRALHGIRRVGSTYQRGISRVGQVATGFATAYTRGVARMGSAAKTSLSDVASDGVSRLGEIATQSAETLGSMATNVADVATAVPKSISNAAKDKKIRDCVLQTMCYVSTPFINPNSNYVKRR
jgi:hypothetical protein